MRRARSLAAIAAIAAVLATLVVPLARADDYADPAYLQHDLDNLSRSVASGRQLASLFDPAYAAALTPVASQSFLTNVGRQVADLPHGRVYATLGQLLPGGAVGDPIAYDDLTPTTVGFLSRTGAKLVGRLWSDGLAGPHPAVVITPGSIQGTQHMYWWAARTLARAGYVVLTFDAQGQGESETFGHAPGDPLPTDAGFPFQQAPNFVDGTVDALRFLYATDAVPYVPGGWTPAQVAAARAAGDGSLSWANPLAGTLDRTRLALAGHSAGAGAISAVQQCAGRSTLWRTLPVCTGRSFPIKAIVAWDGLSSSGNIIPTVPAMDQQADGYFLYPQPTTEAPDPTGNLSAFRRWRSAGMDAFSFTVRGGTHLEWVDVPYILPSTTYGVRMADFYTLAWIERYTAPTVARRVAAADALLAGPRREPTADQLPWRADFMSARSLGAFAFHDGTGARRDTSDLRAYGGASPVGDWPGANANQPAVRGG